MNKFKQPNYVVAVKCSDGWQPLVGYAPASKDVCIARRHIYMTTWQQNHYKVMLADSFTNV